MPKIELKLAEQFVISPDINVFDPETDLHELDVLFTVSKIALKLVIFVIPTCLSFNNIINFDPVATFAVYVSFNNESMQLNPEYATQLDEIISFGADEYITKTEIMTVIKRNAHEYVIKNSIAFCAFNFFILCIN